MIHEEICTYEVCKLAKEKGFPIECDLFYNRNEELCDDRNYDSFYNKIWCFAPTQSLLQRWLREKKGIHIEIVATACGYFWIIDKTNGTSITDSDVLDRGANDGGCWDTYELALEDALKYALENLI
jgi:hypothetical protein